MFWAAAIPAMASLAGDLLGMKGQQDTNMANAEEARKNRLFQAQEASLNRQFQEQMSSTAYQRAVQDMKGAGLNPALAYQQGGASSPAGNAPSGAQAVMQNKFAGAGGSARAAAMAFEEVATAKANRSLIEAQAAKTRAETGRVNTLTSLEAKELTSRAFNQEQSGWSTEYARKFREDTRELEQAMIRAGIARDSASARDLISSAVLKEADQARAFNFRDAAQTWWGKKFAPFLQDASSVGRLLSTPVLRR